MDLNELGPGVTGVTRLVPSVYLRLEEICRQLVPSPSFAAEQFGNLSSVPGDIICLKKNHQQQKQEGHRILGEIGCKLWPEMTWSSKIDSWY